jgi:hypothetical protein
LRKAKKHLIRKSNFVSIRSNSRKGDMSMDKKAFCFLLLLVVPLILSGCGGGNSSDGGGVNLNNTGTVSIRVTDAKPVLPLGVERVLITFDEVSVHKTGGGWISLPLALSPYTIDLLQFSDGKTTELVPPVSLISGKYTQIRIGVTEAFITINGVDYPVEIPSENLKTDKEFDFEVVGGGAVDLMVDFDLSQSIVVTGQNTYKLKPVLHVNETQEAATLHGEISDATFGSAEATIIVTWDKDQSGGLSIDDEEYTRVTVTKGPVDPTEFSIYWLVPDEGYNVEIEVGGTLAYEEFVPWFELPAGGVFLLNLGNPI